MAAAPHAETKRSDVTELSQFGRRLTVLTPMDEFTALLIIAIPLALAVGVMGYHTMTEGRRGRRWAGQTRLPRH
jgi:hypothetical protein